MAEAAVPQYLPAFERFLSVWVLLAIVSGVLLGLAMPGLFGALAALEYASVNIPVALLIWAMIFPMMVGVEFAGIARAFRQPKGLVITLTVNWLVKPFTMALLGILFFRHLFADLITPADADLYLAGLILLGAAPCTAMVFVWSQLVKGDPSYTLTQVSGATATILSSEGSSPTLSSKGWSELALRWNANWSVFTELGNL